MEAAAAYRHRRLRIGALLLRSGLLSADRLAEALEEKEQTGERLGEIVVRRGWVTEAQVAKLLADQSDLPFISLATTPSEPRVESLLSSRVGAYFRAVPVRFVNDDTVLVAVSDPTSVAIDDLRSAIGLDVGLAVATDSEIKAALARLDPTLPTENALSPPEEPDPLAVPHVQAPEATTEPAETPDEVEPATAGPDAEAEVAVEASTADAGLTEPGHLASIVVTLPGPEPAGAETETSDEAIAAPGDGATEELVAIVEIPAALRGELIEPSEPDVDDLLVPVEDPVPARPDPSGGHGFPTGPAPSALDLSTVEPVAGVPLLRVIGAPPADVPAPPDLTHGPDPDPFPPSPSDLWLPTSAQQPPVEPVLWSPTGSPHVEAWTPAIVWPAVPPTEELVEPEGDADEPEPATPQPDPEARAEPDLEPEETEPEPEAAAPEAVEPEATEPEPDEVEPDPVELGAVDSDAVEPEEVRPDPAEPEAVEPEATEPEAAEPDETEPEAAGPGWSTDGQDDDAPPSTTTEPVAGEAPDREQDDEAAAEPAAPALEAIETSLFPVADVEEPAEVESAAIVPLFEHRRPQLGTILLRQGLVTPEQVAAGLEEKEESGERLGRILVQTGALSEQGLATALAEQHDLDYLDIAAAPPNVAVASLLPAKYARRYRAVPVRYLEGGTLLVAVADPTDVLASDDLRLVLGVQIQLAVALGSDIDATLDRVHPEGATTIPTTMETEEPEAADHETPSGFRRQGPVEVLEATTNAPAIELVNEVIKHAIQEGASDVHFEPQSERMLVRARIDGVMREVRIIPARLQQAVSARLKIMGELDIAERRAPQDGRVTITFGGRPVDLRIAVLPTLYGEQIVIRVLYRSSSAADLADLGLAADTEAAICHAIAQPYGALLSVGPTGSGKTTTLYSALRLLNTEDRCVMTIEDPVEYQLEGLNQVQVNVKAGLTFAHGLRTILRSDPDVLLVGEIRDSETAKIAVQAAMTGHLVLSTLHADNVGSAVSRMTDMGVERQLLASTINVILAQRLARKLCTNCREAFPLDPGLLLKAGADERVLPASGPVTLFKPRGCGQCTGGYKGRIGLFETMLVTPKMRRLMETATAEEIYEVAVTDGMRTLQDDGLRLCIEGLTSLDEVKRVAGERRI